MAEVVSIGVEDGGPVVRRRADADGAVRLRSIGQRLSAAAHPGVVRVVLSAPVEHGWELVTGHAGHPVTAARARSPQRLAAIGADAAGTLADLHAAGVRHGRLDRDRVLVGPGGRAILCGFGPDDGGAHASDDVRALGSVLQEVADELGPLDRHAEVACEQLRAVLAAATADRPDRRPPARRLAAELTQLATAPASGSASRRRASWVIVVAALLVVAVGALLRGRAPASSEPPGTVVSNSAGPGSVTSSIASTVPCVAVAGAPVDDPRCGHTAAVEDGAVVVDGVRSVVARDGDEVAVGDWDCDGEPEPVVLRPASGEVLLFGPPDAAGGRVVRRSSRVPGGVGFAFEGADDGCPALGVVDAAGERTGVSG